MKKKVLLCLLVILTLFTITGCKSTSKEKRTVEYLLDQFVKEYMTADADITKDIFPPYYVDYAKEYMTNEYLQKTLNEDKEKYGKDFNISYELKSKEKFTDEELYSFNKKIVDYFKTDLKAKECYKLDGDLIYKGSKKEDKESLSSFGYCNYDDEWYLVRR